jgi:hypothetical protein
VIANNVLAHVPDQNDFVAGLRLLLKDEGVASIEVPYVRELVDHCEFDTIYHEHHCYFSVTALHALFSRYGLALNAVQPIPIHGGSLRLQVSPHAEGNGSVARYLAEEASDGLAHASYYRDFAAQVEKIKEALHTLLAAFKREGARVAAYGAAAKGATLLNYCGIGSDHLDFVVDRNVHKQGRYMPGVHLPIRDPSTLLSEQPDVVLLLTWNFRDEILAQQQTFRDRGGRFIVPIPFPEVV